VLQTRGGVCILGQSPRALVNKGGLAKARPKLQLRKSDAPVTLDPLSLTQKSCIHSWFH